jgi:tetratricopeptide (TPR) repeat protein
VKRDEVMQSGMRQHQAGQLAVAETIYRQVLRENPDDADAIQLLGIIAGQRGDRDTAIELIRKSIQLKPDHPGAYRNLAPLLAQKGQLDDAIAAYRKFLELRPNSPEIHVDLGAALKACGRLDEASISVSKAIELKPDFAFAHNELGNIAVAQRRADDAIAAYSKAIGLKPNFAEAHNNLGNVLGAKGLLEEGLAAYRRAVACNPNFAPAHNGIGNMLRCIGRNDEAIGAYRTAIRLKPDFALAHFNLGQAYRVAERLGEALAACQEALKIDSNNAEVHASIAMILSKLNRFDEAMNAQAQIAILNPNAAITHDVLGKILLERRDAAGAAEHFRRAIAIDPNFDTAWHGLGMSLQSLGQFDEAAKCFRRVLEICPRAGAGIIYRHLFETGATTIGAAEIEQVKEFLREPNIPTVSRFAAGFALGKALDDAGQFDEAFASYDEANALAKKLRTSIGEIYDPDAVHRLNEQLMAVFTRSYFEERRGWGDASELPVFIVGMPRSGTTLLQQILASHPQVYGAGELSDIADITRSLGGTDVKSAAMGWRREVIDAAAHQHVRKLRSMDENALRIVDKMPSNVHRLSLIALFFPSARVIFCNREARDTCLSCYFQWFATGNTFAFDLAHCGHEQLATDRLMRHWREVLPMKMLDVRYEDLVADLEDQSRRLIEFLGLPWDPACLDFHHTKTTIMTASSWQARQPIYQKSVGRWRNYERHLGPLLEVLNGSL